MVDWYEFLDPRFRLSREAIRSRHRVVTVCTECSQTSVVLVSNLKVTVKRQGTYRCFSCNARRGALSRNQKS